MGMEVRPLPEVEPSTPAPKGSTPEVEQTPSAPVSAGSRLLAVLGSWRARLALMSIWGVLLFVAFQPGLLSSDSLDMLAQGRLGRYSDWHSPFFSFLLGKCFALTGSTWPILAIQLLGLALGPVLLLGRVAGRRGLGALALLVVYCLLPSTWAVGVTLWKDVFNAVALLGAVVLLTRGRPGWAFACLVAATLTRHNAIVASVPLVPMVVARVPALMKERARPFIASGILLGILACAPGFVERAMGAQKSWIGGTLLVFDVLGVYAREPSAMERSPLVERWRWTPEQLGGLYDPRSITPLLWGDPARGSISMTQVLEARDSLTREWLRVVRTHPGAYLRHRLSAYAASLGVGDSSDSYYRDIGSYHRAIEANDLGLKLRTHTAVHRALAAMREGFPWVVGRGAPWLALTLVLAGVGWRRRARDGGLMFCVAASGACYALAYLPVSVSAEYRFYYWTAISAFAASALWLARPPRAAHGHLR
ncbi:hypothetical protein SAMN05443572_10738 [Myxococcus fulvus]|uniref:Glycosyltransferase RgtA/B/C/D-like domain-containing protein n=1 Tax=Myxococcus fulvus TaxID=33 RepID=A0A511T7U1_MYXFU|nr:hypothetical protein [Myxococcus fulvus]GEN10057.1 hypothetical protein MFU01_50940 [Myxococcus fulvus]SEU25048.1 hypothetical protein SAMN05443572_10738 [Myxococcus fulvus]